MKSNLAGVDILGKMEILTGVAFLIFGIALIPSIPYIMMFPDRIPLANYGEEKLTLIAYANIILGIFAILIGLSLFSMKESGRKTAIALSVFVISVCIFSILVLNFVIGFIDIILGIAVIIYLNLEDVKEEYRRRR